MRRKERSFCFNFITSYPRKLILSEKIRQVKQYLMYERKLSIAIFFKASTDNVNAIQLQSNSFTMNRFNFHKFINFLLNKMAVSAHIFFFFSCIILWFTVFTIDINSHKALIQFEEKKKLSDRNLNVISSIITTSNGRDHINFFLFFH